MCKAVAYKRLKTMENYKTVTPKSGRGRLQKVVVMRSSNYRAFWCFWSVNVYGRWPLTRGDRRWRFDCIPSLRKRFLNLSLWAPLKFVYEKISWVTNGSHYFFLLLFIIYYYFFLLRSRKDIVADLEPRRFLNALTADAFPVTIPKVFVKIFSAQFPSPF